MPTRKIIHLDLDAFFCAVEENLRPELVGKPFAVGGRPEARGVVSSCSYAARMFGISSAMPMAKAIRICPNLIIIPGNHNAYSEASHKVMEILGRYSGLIEQISIDEAFLDVTDIQKPAVEIGKEIQSRIQEELHLPCSLGIATNKLVAKIATDVGKAAHRKGSPPRSILEVEPGKEAEFLAPLPVRAMWGIGPKTAKVLADIGIHTIGQLAAEPMDAMVKLFGRYGPELHHHALGIDSSPISTEHEVKSISQEITFEKDIRDIELIHRWLRELSEKVGYRLRKDNLVGATIRIKVRWPDFSTQTRQTTLNQPTSNDRELFTSAQHLFDELWQQEKRPVRLIGVGVSGLQEEIRQLSLWETPTDRERRLLEAMDELKAKYGRKIIQRGDVIKTHKGKQ